MTDQLQGVRVDQEAESSRQDAVRIDHLRQAVGQVIRIQNSDKRSLRPQRNVCSLNKL